MRHMEQFSLGPFIEATDAVLSKILLADLVVELHKHRTFRGDSANTEETLAGSMQAGVEAVMQCASQSVDELVVRADALMSVVDCRLEDDQADALHDRLCAYLGPFVASKFRHEGESFVIVTALTGSMYPDAFDVPYYSTFVALSSEAVEIVRFASLTERMDTYCELLESDWFGLEDITTSVFGSLVEMELCDISA